MKIFRSKTMANAVSLILMLAMAFSLVALPFANAQPALIMNLPGPDGVPHYVLFGTQRLTISTSTEVPVQINP